MSERTPNTPEQNSQLNELFSQRINSLRGQQTQIDERLAALEKEKIEITSELGIAAQAFAYLANRDAIIKLVESGIPGMQEIFEEQEAQYIQYINSLSIPEPEVVISQEIEEEITLEEVIAEKEIETVEETTQEVQPEETEQIVAQTFVEEIIDEEAEEPQIPVDITYTKLTIEQVEITPQVETEAPAITVKINPFTLSTEINGAHAGLHPEELILAKAIHFYRQSGTAVRYSHLEKMYTQLGGNLPEVPADIQPQERSKYIVETLLSRMNTNAQNRIHQEVKLQEADFEWQKKNNSKHPSFPPEAIMALQYIFSLDPKQKEISFDEIKPILGFIADKNGDIQHEEWTLPQFIKLVNSRMSLITSASTAQQNRRSAIENRLYKNVTETYASVKSSHFSEDELKHFVESYLNKLVIRALEPIQIESIPVPEPVAEQPNVPDVSTEPVVITGVTINGSVYRMAPRFRYVLEVLAENPGISGQELSEKLKEQGIKEFPSDFLYLMRKANPWIDELNVIETQGVSRGTTRRINPNIKFGLAYETVVSEPESKPESKPEPEPVEIPHNQRFEQHTVAAILSIVDPTGMFNTVFDSTFRPENKDLSAYMEQAEECIRNDQHLEMLFALLDPTIFNERSKRLFKLVCDAYRKRNNIEVTSAPDIEEVIELEQNTQKDQGKTSKEETNEAVVIDEVIISEEDSKPDNKEEQDVETDTVQHPDSETFEDTFHSRITEIEQVIAQVATEMGRGTDKISIPHAIQVSKRSGIRGLSAQDLKKMQFEFGLKLPSLSSGNYHPYLTGRQLAVIMAYHEIIRRKSSRGATKELNDLVKSEF